MLWIWTNLKYCCLVKSKTSVCDQWLYKFSKQSQENCWKSLQHKITIILYSMDTRADTRGDTRADTRGDKAWFQYTPKKHLFYWVLEMLVNQHCILFPQCILPYDKVYILNKICHMQMLSNWTKLKFCHLVKAWCCFQHYEIPLISLWPVHL